MSLASPVIPSRICPPEGLSARDLAYFASPARDGRFTCPWGEVTHPTALSVLRWKLGRSQWADEKRRAPRIPVAADPLGALAGLRSDATATWLGHSTFLLEIDGLRILTDPIFGSAGLVFSRAVPAPIAPEALPPIDIVLISHAHFDHLDRASLRALGRRFGRRTLFLVPTGAAKHVPRECERVVELGWWEAVTVEGIDFAFVPGHHWHQRGLFDVNESLWGGWCVLGSRRAYFAGDTGSFGGFDVIGRVIGGFDLALLPLGAYEPRWINASQHVNPEEAVQAFLDLRARHFVGMHWGTFDMTDEPLDHGPRVLADVIARRGLDASRFHVLPHGGSLGIAGASLEIAA